VSDYVGKPHRGAWLVYLNGIEVPCAHASVSYGVGVIPEATLSFPPHRLLQRLGTEDRVEVVIFYLDDLADPQNPEFRLLFEGEIIGWSYTSASHNRQMTFNAVADIAIFTQLHFFFLNNVDAVAANVANAGAGAEGVAQAGALYPFSLFKKGLLFNTPIKPNDPPVPDVTRPFEILYNVVRGMVDAGLDPKRRAIPSVNFFARWVRKRNFVNRFAALPIFEDELADSAKGVFPILQAAQATSAMQAMQQNLAQSIGDAGTLWEVLREIFGHVFFEVAMLPTAPAARVRLSDGVILKPAAQAASSIQNTPTEPIRLLNYFVKPQMFFGIAPTCNVMFPSMITNYSYSESYVAQPTRTYVNDQFISGVLSQNVFTAAALTFGYPEEADAVLAAKTGKPQAEADAAAKKAGKPSGVVAWSRRVSLSGKNLLVFPEEFFKGPVVHRMSVPAWFTALKIKEPKTGSTASTGPAPASTEESRSLHQLMASYVEYEHFRARYEKRGGAVNMAWNPYVVPGFPCVIFDQKSSSFHTVGYLNNVQQTLSQSGMETAVNYGMARTIPEMLDLLNNELVKNPGKVFGSAPLEPITSIRDIIQDFTKAEQFYNALFFQRQQMTEGKKAAFDFREVLGYARSDGKTDPIKVETVQVGSSSPVASASATQSFDSAGSTETSTVRVSTLVGNRDVVPLPSFVPVFNQYDTAMKYVARPICSITDYVAFIHGGAPLGTLTQPGTTVGNVVVAPQVEAGDDRFGEVVYFKRIKRLIQGPGAFPTAAVLGFTGSGKDAKAYEGVPSGVTEYVQTRADWDTALEAYRAEMYSRKGPQE
jgi:hypothetical protein